MTDHPLTDTALVAKYRTAAADACGQPCDHAEQTVIAVPAGELARLCEMAVLHTDLVIALDKIWYEIEYRGNLECPVDYCQATGHPWDSREPLGEWIAREWRAMIHEPSCPFAALNAMIGIGGDE